MKVSQIMLFGFFFIGISSMEAQDKTSLTLDQAIQMAWNKSNEVTMANTKVETSRLELQSAKNNQYPDFKISGQYQRLTKATIDLKLTTSSSSSDPLPIVDQLVLGQANATLPVFAGFKIQNSN